jgi:hypothetical protein
MPARILAAATPPESPSHHRPHPYPPLRPRPRLRFPAGPPRLLQPTAIVRIPRPHHHPQGKPSSFTQTRAFVPFRLLCPSIPTPSPLFRLHPRGIDGHRRHLHLPQRIPPVQKGLRNLSPDPLLLEFLKPPSGRRIGAIWAGPIAPSAAGDPHIQDPVEDLAVIHPRSPGFGPGRQQGRNARPRFIGQLLNPHRPSPPRQVVQRQSILQPDTRVLR